MNVLLVDGYNIIGAWEELNYLKRKDISLARDRLLEILIEYKAYSGERVIVVFDALYVKGMESKQSINDVEVIYTKEDETADECIERLVQSLKNVKNQVYVATSDYLEQRTIFSRGALRKSARELLIEINEMDTNIKGQIEQQSKENPKITVFSETEEKVLQKLEKWRRGKKE